MLTLGKDWKCGMDFKMDMQCSEDILLLGAGFTKNCGGLLANEMWTEIFNHEKIQDNSRLRTKV